MVILLALIVLVGLFLTVAYVGEIISAKILNNNSDLLDSLFGLAFSIVFLTLLSLRISGG